MLNKLTQENIEDLSAFFDGELPPERAAEVQRLVQTDADWAAAYADLQALDSALGELAAPPVPQGLADRIVADIHRQQKPRLFRMRWIAPVAAAAAAVVIAVTVWTAQVGREKGPSVAQTPSGEVQQVDELVQENLDFFQNMSVLQDYETLAAIERLEEDAVN